MTSKPYLLSVNVGKITQVLWRGDIVKTGIYKKPTLGKLKVQGVHIDGDEQADTNAHGGENKAIYGYPHEHYGFWKSRYPKLEFKAGIFGENLTTCGILEEDLYIGDKLVIGEVELIVVQPRMPCFKLGIKFGSQGIIKEFEEAEKPGFYLKIGKAGEIETGSDIEIIRNENPQLTIVDVMRINRNKASRDVLEKALLEPHLPDRIQERAQMYLDRL